MIDIHTIQAEDRDVTLAAFLNHLGQAIASVKRQHAEQLEAAGLTMFAFELGQDLGFMIHQAGAEFAG